MKQTSSWQPVSKWYDRAVGDRGHYFHEHVVIPGVLRLLGLDKTSSLLDLAWGQGVLGRAIPKDVAYVGIDASFSLIQMAKKRDTNPRHEYHVSDVVGTLPVEVFVTHAALVLSLQNIADPEAVISNCAKHLAGAGTLIIVLNHPCFRIPRQSSWGIDEASKLQYRRVNRYMSPLKIPITTHPGQTSGPVTWSFHRSLTDYFFMIAAGGFVITGLEEWVSDRESEGKASRMENRGRVEIPLFLAIKAKKEE